MQEQDGSKTLPIGKLDSDLLKEIVFNNLSYRRPEVLTRPGIGEDCAVIDFGEYECVMSTDPITAAISEIGRLSVHISCNDIAANGIEPLGIMLAVLLPIGTTQGEIEEMMLQAGAAAAELGVEIIGGHTEVTAAVVKPVIISTALGRGLKGSSPRAEEMKPGDLIYMTKWVGLEGTGIIASDFSEKLKGILSREELAEAVSLLDLVSVVKEGVLAGKIGVVAMHDVTEGGLLGALWELCQIAGTGAQLWEEKIPILPLTEKMCNFFKIDPLRLISSGTMLMIVAPEKKKAMEEAMAEAEILLTHIGVIKEADEGLKLFHGNQARADNPKGDSVQSTEISPPVGDELYRIV